MASDPEPLQTAPSVKSEELNILTIGLPAGWAVRRVESEGKKTSRLHYVNHVNRSAHWIPPPENWKCPNLLPYGWELGIDDDGHIYYINHLNETTTRKDPRLQATYDDQNTRKDFLLEKSDNAADFGFTLSDNPPYVVTSVQSGGAAAPWLNVNDGVSRIGNVEIFELSREEVSDLLKQGEKSGTVKIQVMYHGKAGHQSDKSRPTQTEDGKLATHLLPGVLLVDLMTGGSRKFRITRTTTAQDIVDNICKRLEITTPEMFGLYIENVTTEKSTLKILYGWQLLAKLPKEIIDSMVANETEQGEAQTRDGDESRLVRIVCRLRFLPGSIEDLYDVDRRAFDYFFHQTSMDVANDRFSSECPNDVAMLLGSLSIAHFCVKQGKKKVSVKEVEKTVGGLQPFFPTSILDRLKTADLRKHVKKALDSQSIDMEQPDTTDLQIKYLSLLAEFPSLAGEKFKCVVEDTNEEKTLLVSPQSGFASIDSPLEAGWCSEVQITTFCTFDGLESIKVEEIDADTATSRVTIISEDTSAEPQKYLMAREAAREMIHLLQGYAQLLAKVELTSDDPVLLLEMKTETDRTPAYRSLHHVATTSWGYFDSAWENYKEMMNLPAEKPVSHSSSVPLIFPVGKVQIDKTTLLDFMAVDLSQKLEYGKRKKRRVIYLKKTGADLARDFLNKPEPLDTEEQEDFTSHLSSRQMANTAVEDPSEENEEKENAPPKQSSAAAAALASLLSRSAPVVDESEGLATAQPLRGIVGTSDYVSSNSMNFNDSNNEKTDGNNDSGWGGSGGLEITPNADAPDTNVSNTAAAGWGDDDASAAKQPSLSEFGVSVRSNAASQGFGFGGLAEEDEIAGW